MGVGLVLSIDFPGGRVRGGLQYPSFSSIYSLRLSSRAFVKIWESSAFVPAGRGSSFCSALSFADFCSAVRVCGYRHFAKASILLLHVKTCSVLQSTHGEYALRTKSNSTGINHSNKK